MAVLRGLDGADRYPGIGPGCLEGQRYAGHDADDAEGLAGQLERLPRGRAAVVELVAQLVGDYGDVRAGVVLIRGERPPLHEMEVEDLPVAAIGALERRVDARLVAVEGDRHGRKDPCGFYIAQRPHPAVA